MQNSGGNFALTLTNGDYEKQPSDLAGKRLSVSSCSSRRHLIHCRNVVFLQ
jgi:hypothetical protein